MSDKTQVKADVDISQAFDTGAVFDFSEENLKTALQQLNKQEYVANDGVRHVFIIRGITVNTLLNMHLIQRIDATNTELAKANTRLTQTNIRLTWIVTFLTLVAVIAAIAQVAIALQH